MPGSSGSVRAARAALRAAAKQMGATLANRTVARLYEPPLNEQSSPCSFLMADGFLRTARAERQHQINNERGMGGGMGQLVDPCDRRRPHGSASLTHATLAERLW